MVVKKALSAAAYKKILDSFPIACVDLLVVYGKEFALVKRNHEPLLGELWFPGGRIFKGETFEKTIKRKLRDEMRIPSGEIQEIKQLTTRETFFKTSAFGVSTHSINVTFLVGVARKNLDARGSDGEIFWFTKIGKNVPMYIRSYLKEAGFR